jgi:hypothetical protein
MPSDGTEQEFERMIGRFGPVSCSIAMSNAPSQWREMLQLPVVAVLYYLRSLCFLQFTQDHNPVLSDLIKCVSFKGGALQAVSSVR